LLASSLRSELWLRVTAKHSSFSLLLALQIGFLFAASLYRSAMLEAVQIQKSLCHCF